MNSKERVYAALRHESADRLPRYIWVGRGAADNLRAALGERAADIDELVGNDVKQTWLSINGEMERPCEEGESFTDEWGIRWHRDGYYNAVIFHPLADLEEEEILAYPFQRRDGAHREFIGRRGFLAHILTPSSVIKPELWQYTDRRIIAQIHNIKHVFRFIFYFSFG